MSISLFNKEVGVHVKSGVPTNYLVFSPEHSESGWEYTFVLDRPLEDLPQKREYPSRLDTDPVRVDDCVLVPVSIFTSQKVTTIDVICRGRVSPARHENGHRVHGTGAVCSPNDTKYGKPGKTVRVCSVDVTKILALDKPFGPGFRSPFWCSAEGRNRQVSSELEKAKKKGKKNAIEALSSKSFDEPIIVFNDPGLFEWRPILDPAASAARRFYSDLLVEGYIGDFFCRTAADDDRAIVAMRVDGIWLKDDALELKLKELETAFGDYTIITMPFDASELAGWTSPNPSVPIYVRGDHVLGVNLVRGGAASVTLDDVEIFPELPADEVWKKIKSI